MSSLRDIMNVDGVEPLPSRTITTSQQEQSSQSLPQLPNQDARYTDTRYQAQPLQLPPLESLSIPSPLSPQPSASTLGRKRSRQSPKTSIVSAFGPLSGHITSFSPGPNQPNPSSSPGRRPSVGTEYMDPRFSEDRSISPSAGYSSSFSDSMARGEVRRGKQAPEITVRYTPVTGRISKAQKGLPVHKCQLCDRKPFSRAEHLRYGRHMTTHGPPSHLCEIPGCDKAFHRKDLLERHMERHNDSQTSPQSRDNGRRSRSSSYEFKAPQPPRASPQPITISMDNDALSYPSRNAPAPVPASTMDANLNMMGQYAPECRRNASSFNQQSYQHAQQYHIRQLASPITMPMEVPSTYAEVSSIVSCAGTSPMAPYGSMSSSSPTSFTAMMPAQYTTSASSFHQNYVPVSEAINPFSPQAQMAREISQRLTRNQLEVDVPHSIAGTAHTSSPLYHSDRESNSTWSTPSDPNKSHFWPTPMVRDQTLSASGHYPPQPPMLNLNDQLRQQEIMQRSYVLEFQDQAVGDNDYDRVSSIAHLGSAASSSEHGADYDQYQSEAEQSQHQYEAQGGQLQQYMEDNYEQHWQQRAQAHGQWPM